MDEYTIINKYNKQIVKFILEITIVAFILLVIGTIVLLFNDVSRGMLLIGLVCGLTISSGLIALKMMNYESKFKGD